MALDALCQCRNPGIGAVFPEKMAAFTAIFNQFIVQNMIKINRLIFLGIEQLRKDDPSEHQAGHQPYDKKQGDGSAGAGIFLLRFRACRGYGGIFILGFILCTDRNSVSVI